MDVADEKDEVAPVALEEMTRREIDQFLTCARVGRVGLVRDGCAYIVPVGFGWADGEIFFHTCRTGLKMTLLAPHPQVCFEVDEAISDGSLGKSVLVFGRAEIIGDRTRMLPYLQKLIDKYRVPVTFDEYMARGKRNVESELKAVRVCVIRAREITSRKLIRTNGNF